MDVDGLSFDRTLIGEHLHPVDKLYNAVGLVADEAREAAVLISDGLLQELRRAANPGKRVLDRVPTWQRARSPSVPRCDG